jgi:hypothetical protein
MKGLCQKRAWYWFAIAAIVIALVALLVHQPVDSPGQPAWLAMLPVFFIGLIVPFTIAPLPGFLSLGSAPEGPALAPSFERPPPFRLA